MRRNRFPRDPYWINTRHPTRLPDGSTMPAGSRAFYFPNSKTLLFEIEAEDAARKFESERFDEDQYSAGYGV